MDKFVIPDHISAKEIKLLRGALGMTQKEFAEFAHVSKRTVERWEYSDEEITGPITVLAEILIKNLDLPDKLRIPERKYKFRLWYMYHEFVCTIIDVDEMERKIAIHNYISNPIYRAFGVNTEPTFEDYEEFIKSRCFPETRDKLKLELKKLDIPFYDPIMIIEKTMGRMADDDFWIRIER
ncbi:putative transcriptional regulator [Butyrivibrio fibrisolvens DSM 3071]|jgi:putative transcriptional regulator|uniref:Putative transcriptional regulator n=1 Tax=Butyrivibrio fibrisolvens DSM 3071 TaxID=1121131 RepID=A0A1M6B5F7_BUTFI|nr:MULTISPECIES: helix-turn-helix domain-containing protein [Butyrivibrio]SHI43961.1 putative transcriptional regulator [Butyrivibrio fibrisolvens DSM 3071]